jgi:hypothetical protein
MKQLTSPVESLQAASDVWFIKAHLRRTANAQLIYASLMIGEGLLKYPEPGSIISLLGAAVLGAEAMWLLRVRKPLPILGAAILLWAAALWNLYLYYASPVDKQSVEWLIVALVYCYFGFREFLRFRKFRAALLAQTPEAAAEIEEIVASLTAPDVRLLQPHVDGDRWQVRLYDNGIVMRNSAKGAMLIGDRNAARVEPQGTTVVGGLAKMKIKIRDRKLSCTFMSDEANFVLMWSAGAATDPGASVKA